MIFSTSLVSQEKIPWFDAHSNEWNDKAWQDKTGDCIIVKSGYDESLQANITELEAKPFFIHTVPEFKKWMGNKYLVEAKAHLYKADKSIYLIIDFKVNSKGAKATYGNLNYGAQMKCFFDDDDFVYLKNVELDKGKINRRDDYTIYQGVFSIDNSNSKKLKRNRLQRIGIIWEEGYQEYDIQNSSLIQNQLECVKG